MNIYKSIAGLAIVVAVISLGLSYKAHSQINKVSDTITKSYNIANNASLTYVISEDGKCYDQYLLNGELSCSVKDAIPYPPTKGLCLSPYTDPKASFCR